MMNKKSNQDWLWDKNIPLSKIIKILKDEGDLQFVEIAALLLSRKNTPKEVFDQWLGKKCFCRNWLKIKKKMRKNAWNDPRIIFWQAVYEKTLKMYKEKGIVIRSVKSVSEPDSLCFEVGSALKETRKKYGLTQKELAQKLKISQQVISRIESGKENPSLITIKKIADALNMKVSIGFGKKIGQGGKLS